jgi:hypothetical protein
MSMAFDGFSFQEAMQWVPRFLGVEKAIPTVASAQKSFCFRAEIHQAVFIARLDHYYEHL